MEKKQLLEKMRLTKDKGLYFNCSLELFSNFDFTSFGIIALPCSLYSSNKSFLVNSPSSWVNFTFIPFSSSKYSRIRATSGLVSLTLPNASLQFINLIYLIALY
mgnify:CR=1 FL=1